VSRPYRQGIKDFVQIEADVLTGSNMWCGLLPRLLEPPGSWDASPLLHFRGVKDFGFLGSRLAYFSWRQFLTAPAGLLELIACEGQQLTPEGD